jgi:phosphonate transport system substrate-binding protein
MKRFLLSLGLLTATVCRSASGADGGSLTFGVVSQRSPILTAQYWNPILRYVSAKSGVPLELRLTRTSQEHAEQVARGALDFIYSNHHFAPENARAGYRVIARPAQAAVTGQIVVLADSPIRSLDDLHGGEVAFPSKAAFFGYNLPRDALARRGIVVQARFAGNQEGAMAQLKAGRAIAAGVHSQVMREFARREGVEYRVLWNSAPFHNLPVCAAASVPAAAVQAVRDALIGMANDPVGARVLAESAALTREEPPFGFVAATDADYTNLRRSYLATRLTADRP